MSTSIWRVKKFRPETVTLVVDAAAMARASGLDYELAATFAGYHAEAVRQRGLRVGCFKKDGGPTTADLMLEAAGRSRHRYSKGKNAKHYLTAARRVLAVRAGLADDAPLEMIWDRLIEMGELPA